MPLGDGSCRPVHLSISRRDLAPSIPCRVSGALFGSQSRGRPIRRIGKAQHVIVLTLLAAGRAHVATRTEHRNTALYQANPNLAKYAIYSKRSLGDKRNSYGFLSVCITPGIGLDIYFERGTAMQRIPPRVLVLEDDALVRDVVTEVLSDHGIEVDAAEDAAAALDKIAERDFDLIVADVRLPGEIDGTDAVRCARERRPWLRSLFISGKAMPRLTDPAIDEFIAKPFRSHELLGCVWELLRRPAREKAEDAAAAGSELSCRSSLS